MAGVAARDSERRAHGGSALQEDRMLRAELGGYEAYAHRVRYRLLPGVW